MRIAIVNHNKKLTDILRTVIDSQPTYEIIWVASSGVEALEKALKNRPDLILIELNLPVIDGTSVTQKIMKETPCAILIVTEGITKNAAKVFEAMGNGALDAATMPTLDNRGHIKGGDELLKKINTIEKLIIKNDINLKETQKTVDLISKPSFPIIAIGSSTGGPKALSEVISRMPANIGASIVIVQHVDVQFSNSLVEWLASQSRLRITVAKTNRRPEIDTVYVAGTNNHLVLTADYTFRYVVEPKDNPYRPSIDEFFFSLASHWQNSGVAVLLTGMGRDGAQGLLALKKAGWHTIAQDKKTSIVYGMPKAAVDINAAQEILPIEHISDAIIRHIKNKGRYS